MNNHSLLGADRSTHLKIVAVSLVAGILVIAGGIFSRPTTDVASVTNPNSRMQATGPVIRAGKPVTWSASDAKVVR